jgi:hypothetical protein
VGRLRAGIALCAMAGVLASCQVKKPPAAFERSVADAHGVYEWKSHRALEGNIHVELEGRWPLDAKFIYEIGAGRTRMRLGDNWPILVWDGSRVWVSPASADVSEPATTLKLWRRLMLMPLMLGEPGVKVSRESARMLGGEEALAAEVMFPETAGLAREATIFADPQTRLVWGMTVATRPGGERIGITFYDYDLVEGVRIATTWRFWRWSERDGIQGQPIGSARVYNLEFTSPRRDSFARPADAREEAVRP